jgi:PhzF family phenazine biosynthesis protein
MTVFPVSPAAAGGGNPAGVVLEPGDLADQDMVRTAIRLNPISETAFVWTDAGDAYRLRYFAPGGEVALCGHATAAAFGALTLAGLAPPPPAELRSTAPGGEVAGRVERVGGALRVWLRTAVARRVGPPLEIGPVAEAMGLPPEVLTSRPAAAIEDVGIRIAVLPVADIAALDAMRPDFRALAELGRELGVTVFYPFVLESGAGKVGARAFAPGVGIDEDPATGTAASALGAFLAREGLIPPAAELRIRQGEAMGRPSEIRLSVRHRGGEPTAVEVGGWVAGQPVPA